MYEPEKEALCLTAANLYSRKLVSGTDGNISLRAGSNHFLITPSGVNKGSLDPSLLLLMDLEGNQIEGTGITSKETGMHCEIYRTREDIGGIIHTHPPAATAFAVCGLTLPQNLLIEVPLLLGKMEAIPYAPPGSLELSLLVKKAIPLHDILFLTNHGIITCAGTLSAAFNKMDALENAAQTILNARILNITLPPKGVKNAKEL